MRKQDLSLARMQQCITLFAAASIIVCGLCYWTTVAARPWAVSIALLVLLGHALILATEFLLLGLTRGDDRAPKAHLYEFALAWFAEVISAPLVFCWRQPFFSRRWPDHLANDSKGRRGLLLVHGLVCNRGFWNAWLQRLTALEVPFVAVNLHPIFGSIDDHIEQIEAAVLQLERRTGKPPVVVAHSMGGLVVRKWWAEQTDAGPAHSRLHHVVTLGTPHQGTWLARFGRSTNARQMQQGSEWLSALAAAEPAGRHQRFTCFYSNCDNIVFPTSTATLEGADNRHLPGFAHVHLGSAKEPWEEVLRLLDT